MPDFLDDEWLTNVEIHDKEECRRSRQRNQVNLRQGQPQPPNPDDADGNEDVIVVNDEDDDHDNDPDQDGNNDHDDDANDIHGNEGDAADGLAPNEGATIVPPEGDPAPVARRTRSNATGPVSNRTRSQSDAPPIWPMLTLDDARQQVDAIWTQHTHTSTSHQARATGRFLTPNRINFFSHEGAESFSKIHMHGYDLDQQKLNDIDWGTSLLMLASNAKNGDVSRYFAAMDVYQDPLDLILDEFPKFGLVSQASAEDNPNFGQAMNGPNAEGFWDASAREISTLQKFCSWTQVKCTQA